MVWKISRDNRFGDFVVEKGIDIKAKPNPYGIGYIMPAFNVYSMSRFDTLKQAERYVERNKRSGDTISIM